MPEKLRIRNPDLLLEFDERDEFQAVLGHIATEHIVVDQMLGCNDGVELAHGGKYVGDGLLEGQAWPLLALQRPPEIETEIGRNREPIATADVSAVPPEV